MGRYLARRLFVSLFTWLVLVTSGFFLVRILPGNPFLQDETLDKSLREKLTQDLINQDPLWSQYSSYVLNIFKGNLGLSYSAENRSVVELIVESFHWTLILGGLAILATILFSLPLAALVSARPKLEKPFLFLARIVFCLPVLVSAPLLIGVFSLGLGWLPISVSSSWLGWIIPVTAVALKPTFKLAVILQTEIARALKQSYTRTHRAMGFSMNVITSYWSSREGLVAYSSYLGVVVVDLLAGSLITEIIFGIPGMGFRLSESIAQRDFLTITGLIVWVGTLVLVLQILVDCLMGLVDPRVRISGDSV